MNTHALDSTEQVREDLDWLAQRDMAVSPKEECHFCNTIRDELARGWMLMDARQYALGKLMSTHCVPKGYFFDPEEA